MKIVKLKIVKLKIVKLKNIKKFAVFSDIHLREPESNLTELFISTLNNLKNIDAVFLLGDIFDFIGVKSTFFTTYWKNTFQTFQDLKNRGIQVYFIEGNHDFGFEHFKSDFLNACFTNYGDFIAELEHNKLGVIHLRHGDNVVCKKNYLKFRSLVKNKFFQTATAFFIPGRIMQFLFSRYAKISRKKDKYRTLPQDFLMNCLDDTKNIFPYINVLIIGHIHILMDCVLKNKTRFLVGQDWLTQPSYLVYNEEEDFKRVFLKNSFE